MGHNKENLLCALSVLTAAIGLFASVAFAQNLPAQQGPSNPAVKAMHDNNSSTPVAGANSFTKSEAMKQIEAKGYTHVTKLKKDKSGVWRGTAVKDGHSGPISVDYQGNVN
ncbi:MAG: hypothetical protein WBW81_16800 [Methylocella sp.]